MHYVCVCHAHSVNLSKFQVNTVNDIRQIVFSHTRLMVIGVSSDLKQPLHSSVAVAAVHSKVVVLFLSNIKTK